jgi:MFS family permease
MIRHPDIAEVRAPSVRWFGLSILLTGTFLANLDVFIVVVALPSISSDLGTTTAQHLGLVAGYQLIYGAGLITAGRLGDRFGVFRVFGCGMALFTAASALCAVSPTGDVLLAARLLQGAGTAVVVPQAYSGIQLLFPGGRRSRPFAALGAVMGIGAISGQLIGGLLLTLDVAGTGWRSIFLVNLPIGVAALAALRYAPLVAPRDRSASFDHLGGVLVVAVLVAATAPLLMGPDLGWPWWAFAMLAAVIPLTVTLIRHECRHDAAGRQPLLPPILFRTDGFPTSIVLVALFNSGLNAFFLLLAVYMQQWRGLSPLSLGAVMVPLALAFAVTSLVVPLLGWREEHLMVAGAAAAALAYAVTAAAAQYGSDAAIICCLAAIGAGQGLFITPMLSVALRSVPAAAAGAGAGVVSTAQQVGAAVGVCVLGILFYGAIDRAVLPSSAFALSVLCISAVTAVSAALSIYLWLRADSSPT